MSRFRKTSLYVLSIAVALSLSAVAATPASAAKTRDAVTVSTASAQSAGPFCVFGTDGDFVHISTAPGIRTASGHGWWYWIDCDYPLAIVTTQLQILRNGSWVNVGSADSVTVPPGGGAGKRATARVTCTTVLVSQWRSVTDTDVIGIFDTSEKHTTAPRSLACTA
ncbi:hypothetical protein ACTMTJ_32205 [Phytohabitans sp. LJ34]|uniref:hypothetical protein n=1 Tax=Phytohabitans sp. LJ34 TaxID=3452217 RepID=UPI003F89BA8A